MASQPTSISLSSLSFSSLSLSSADSSSSSSPNSHSPSLPVASFVPFLWEEKPGISKRDNMRKIDEETNSLCSPSTSTAADSLEFPPLRLPPRLQESPHLEASLSQSDRRLGGVRDWAVSESFTRRLQRKWNLDDDPFWRAMKVCTKEETSASSDKKDAKSLHRGLDKTATRQNQLRKNSRESATFGKEWDFSSNAMAGSQGKARKGSESKARGRRNDAVELSCGRSGKQFSSNKQSVHDLFGCVTNQSVKEACVVFHHRGGRFASSSSIHHHHLRQASVPSSLKKLPFFEN